MVIHIYIPPQGKSKPSVVLSEGETEELYYKECERFINDPLTCRSMMYYVDVYDPGNHTGDGLIITVLSPSKTIQVQTHSGKAPATAIQWSFTSIQNYKTQISYYLLFMLF